VRPTPSKGSRYIASSTTRQVDVLTLTHRTTCCCSISSPAFGHGHCKRMGTGDDCQHSRETTSFANFAFHMVRGSYLQPQHCRSASESFRKPQSSAYFLKLSGHHTSFL